MGVEIDLVYEGDLRCAATHGPSKNTLSTDAPVDNGGKGAAFSPTDLVATALGACLLTIMGLVAQRNGLDIRGTRVQVVKEMTAVPARRIGKLTAVITFPQGLQLSAENRLKLEQSAKTCPVKQSLHPDLAVDMKFEYAG